MTGSRWFSADLAQGGLEGDIFLTASLVSLIAAGLTCADRGPLGLERCPRPKAGSTGLLAFKI